jgi:hypothetical protein
VIKLSQRVRPRSEKKLDKVREINAVLQSSKKAKSLKAIAKIEDNKIVYTVQSKKTNKPVLIRLSNLLSLLSPEEARLLYKFKKPEPEKQQKKDDDEQSWKFSSPDDVSIR